MPDLRLTAEEISLGENVSDREWRDIYQPEGVGFRNHPLPHPGGQAGVTGASAGGVAGAGQGACADIVGEAAEWRRLGEFMVGEE